MENITYKALVVEEEGNRYSRKIKELTTENLFSYGEVLIRVHYSSLNYKDALSAIGNKGVTKKYPHTPGIDAAGVVTISNNENFRPGDKVIVTGYDLGMNMPGGFGEYICVPSDWIVKLPEGLTLKESMIIGTAGFTAGISISRLSELVSPEMGEIIVSGGTGGVGSMSLSMLAKLGYQTVAITGKTTEKSFFETIGCHKIIARNEFESLPQKAILSAKYAGGIDTVGGGILENIIKQIQPLGAVTTCGSIHSTQLNISVFPFILRGISLIGVSAQNYPMNLREKLWKKLATDWKPEQLLNLYTEISLSQLSEAIDTMLEGKLKGRILVNLTA